MRKEGHTFIKLTMSGTKGGEKLTAFPEEKDHGPVGRGKKKW